MKILIKVTKEILKRSAMCPALSEIGFDVRTSCAIALAVREIFPGSQTYGFGIVFDPHKDPCSYNKESYDIWWGNCHVSRWINSFDNLLPSQRIELPEFSFEIEVPQSVIDQIGIGEVYRILSESKTLELVSI